MRSSRSDGSSRLPWRKNKAGQPKKRRFFGRREEDHVEPEHDRHAHGTHAHPESHDDERYEEGRYEDERYDDARHDDERYDDERDDAYYADSRYDDPEARADETPAARRARGRRIDARHKRSRHDKDRARHDRARDDRARDDESSDDEYRDDSYRSRKEPVEEIETERRVRRRRFSLPKRGSKKSRGEGQGTPSSLTKYLMYGGAGLALLILLLPTLIGFFNGGSFLVNALADINGTVHVGSASLGWFSATTFHDVEIRDSSGATVLKLPELTTEKTALSLYFDSSDLGKVTLNRPQAFVTFDSGGSNIERVLAPWLEGPASLDCPRMALQVDGGIIECEDVRQNSKWQFQDVKVAVDMERNWSEPMKLLAVAKMPQPDGATDMDLQLTLDRRGGSGGEVRQRGTAEISTDNFPLAAFQPIARRLSPDSNLQGNATMKVSFTWGNIDSPGWNMSIDGQLEATDLRISAPELGGDEIYLRAATLPLKMAYVDDRLTIEKLSSVSDVGRVELAGSVLIDTRDGLSAGLMQALTNQAYEFKGQLDLAKVAAILPRTIRLKDGIQITQGDVKWRLAHALAAGGTGTWGAMVETSQLRARRGDEVISWDNPINLEFSAKESRTGLEIEKFMCYSDFVTVEMLGTLDEADIAAEFQLAPLSRELNRFIDFGQTTLGGQGYVYVKWKRLPNGAFETSWDSELNGLEVALAGHTPWREDRLLLNGRASGAIQNGQLSVLDSATMTVQSGVDNLKVDTTAAVRRPTQASTWPLHVSLQGVSATWLDRLQMLTDSAYRWNGRADGSVEIDAGIVISPRQVTMQNDSKIRLRDFVLETRNWKVTEPTLDAVIAAVWDPQTDVIDVPSLRVSSSTGEITANNARFQWPRGGNPSLEGVLHVRADLAKVQAWRRVEAKHGIAGTLDGDLRITKGNGTSIGNWNGGITNFSLQTGESAKWQERNVTLSATAEYDRRADRLQVLRALWQSQALTCDATGEVAQLMTTREISANGQLTYDPSKLAALLQPYVGNGVQIAASRQPHPFRLHGVLTPDNNSGMQVTGTFLTRADGAAQASWTSADIYGFRMGAGEVTFTLANGLLTMQPLSATVNNGTLYLEGLKIDLLEEQPRLYLDPGGRVLSNVVVTPDVARFGSLRYVIPWINGVTTAQGRFTLDVDGAHVPLTDPLHAEAAGKLIVHDISFVPGPLLRQVGFWADLVRQLAGSPTQTAQLSEIRLKQQSTVSYRVVDQRVYHRDLVLVFEDGLTIETQGWVGFDQSQAILAKITAPNLFAKIPGGEYLAQNGLEIPIAGTVTQPQLDVARVQQQLGGTAQSLLQRAAASGNRMLAEELQRQLQKLLSPIR